MLEAYCFPRSALPGETLPLHVSTDAGTFDVEVAREGAQRTVVWRAADVAADAHATPSDAASNGCAWPAALEIPIGTDWRSGYYAVTLRAGDERAEAFLVVRPSPGGPRAPIILVLSTSTWNAYNDWGGPSLYTGGAQVSFERNTSRTFGIPYFVTDLGLLWTEATGRRYFVDAGLGLYAVHRRGFIVDVELTGVLPFQDPDELGGFAARVALSYALW